MGDTSAGTTLRAHLSESFDLIIEEMTQLVLEEVPELAEVAGPQAIRESAQANVEVLLQLMDHPEDLNRISAPLGAIALVRHAAQRGTPFYQVVRGYQLAESFWNQVCMRAVLEEQETFGTPMPMLTEASRVVHAYVDRICGQLSEEYALTDERVRSHLRSRQMKRITSILAGTTGSLAEAESDLRFRLNRRHLASVLWFDDRRDPGTGMAELKRLPAVVGAALGTSTQPLVAVRNESTVWTWFRVADEQQTDEIADQVRQACRDIDGAKVALGLPASGVDGFVSSHRQATTAHSIGSLGGSQHRVFAFGEVSCLNFLVSDVARARAWIRDVLGPLAVDSARESELRETLFSYISSGCNIAATARVLNCHKNTVAYRLRSAEAMLGRSFDRSEIGLGLALLATHWLSELLLHGAPSD